MGKKSKETKKKSKKDDYTPLARPSQGKIKSRVAKKPAAKKAK
jgi:hypothetical protein